MRSTDFILQLSVSHHLMLLHSAYSTFSTFVLMGLSWAYYPPQLLFMLSVIFLESWRIPVSSLSARGHRRINAAVVLPTAC